MAQWQRGLVQWFDKSSGEGVVIGDDGESYYVHYSTIVAKSDRSQTTGNKPVRRNLEPGKEVKFQVYENIYSKRVNKVQAA